MKDTPTKKQRVFTAIAIQPSIFQDLKHRTEELGISMKAYTDASVDYFLRHRINPTERKKKSQEDLALQLMEFKAKLDSTHNTFVAFIRKQETDLLKPMKLTIEQLEQAVKKIESLSNTSHRFMDEIVVSVVESETTLLEEFIKNNLYLQLLVEMSYEMYDPRQAKTKKENNEKWLQEKMGIFYKKQNERLKQKTEFLNQLRNPNR